MAPRIELACNEKAMVQWAMTASKFTAGDAEQCAAGTAAFRLTYAQLSQTEFIFFRQFFHRSLSQSACLRFVQ